MPSLKTVVNQKRWHLSGQSVCFTRWVVQIFSAACQQLPQRGVRFAPNANIYLKIYVHSEVLS